MRRAVGLGLLMLFMTTFLSGCYDAHEINDWAYVYTIGLDKGVSNRLRLTIQVPTLYGPSGGGGNPTATNPSVSDYTVMSVDTNAFYTGVNMINTSLSKKVNYMHTKYLIIGEDLARAGIGKYLNGLTRNRQIRRITHVIVVRGKASDFINKFHPRVGTALSKVEENLVEEQNDTGLFHDHLFGQFYDDLKNSTSMPSATLAGINNFSHVKSNGQTSSEFIREGGYYAGTEPRLGGNHYELMGTALFNGDKMVGELNGTETRALLMLRGEFVKASIAFRDPLHKNLIVTCRIMRQKTPDIRVSFDPDGVPSIHVDVFLEGDLQALQSNENYEAVKKKRILEKHFEHQINGDLKRVVEYCQKLNVDCFAFGETVIKEFATIQEWRAYHWLDRFPDARITTKVHMSIRRTGVKLKSSPMYSAGTPE